MLNDECKPLLLNIAEVHCLLPSGVELVVDVTEVELAIERLESPQDGDAVRARSFEEWWQEFGRWLTSRHPEAEGLSCTQLSIFAEGCRRAWNELKKNIDDELRSPTTTTSTPVS